MVDRVHRCDHGEEYLRRANITRRLIAADVLFTGLEGESVSRPAGCIVRDADEPSRHVPFVGVTGGKIGCMRAAKTKRNAEALRATNGNIGTYFTRWL